MTPFFKGWSEGPGPCAPYWSPPLSAVSTPPARILSLALIVLAGICCSDGVAGADGDPQTPPAWRMHQPAGWMTLTDQTWTKIDPWSYNPRSSVVAIVPDPQAGSAAEFRYPAGFQNGNDVAFLGHYGVSGARGLYVAVRVKFSDNWTFQDPLTKVMHVMAAGWNIFLAANDPDPGWPEFYGPNAGQWNITPTGWGGRADGLPEVDQPRQYREPFNNVNPAAARIRVGEWQTVEVALVRGTGTQPNGSLRLWVDGVLTAEHTAVRVPSGAFANLHFAGTWGGGSVPRVPADQWFRLSHTFIAVPR